MSNWNIKKESIAFPNIERALALDIWLTEIAGASWIKLRSQLVKSELISCKPRNLSIYFLVVLCIARQYLNQTNTNSTHLIRDSIEKWCLDPPTCAANLTIGDESYVALLKGHDVILSDLKNVIHPSISGHHLIPLFDKNSKTIPSEILTTLNEAISLIEISDPVSIEQFRQNCGAICLLKTNPIMPIGKCISTTSKLIPGLIYLTPTRVILTAESLVHESAHLYLSGLEQRQSFYAISSTNSLVITPLRPDPRPISGLFHQVWVLANLVRLYGQFLKTNTNIIDLNFEKIKKRHELHLKDLIQGLNALDKITDDLAPAGLVFYKNIKYCVSALI